MAFDATDFRPAPVDPATITDPRERLVFLRDFIAKLPAERFYIGNYVSTGDGRGWRGADSTENLHDCGTAACIAGWAAFLFSREAVSARYSEDLDSPPVHDIAAGLIGLTEREADNLFVPMGPGFLAWSQITNAHAAAVLTHLINTGEVDWSVARGPS
jgi:hypothetical protein